MKHVGTAGLDVQMSAATQAGKRHDVKHLLRVMAHGHNGHDAVKDDRDKSRGLRWMTGVQPLDACLPEGGLSHYGLHEIEPLGFSDMPSLTGFAFALLSRLRPVKPIIWCVTQSQIGDHGQPYAFGISRYGISPAQIIFVRVAKDRDLPFALEEAIKTKGVAAVIGEGQRPCFTGSRRLALLCKAHERPCLFMAPNHDNDRGSAALTRFRIAAMPGVEDPRDPFGPGLPQWRVALPRARGGRAMPGMDHDATGKPDMPYPWRIFWDDETLSFCPAAVFCNSAAHQAGSAAQDAPQTMVGRRRTG